MGSLIRSQSLPLFFDGVVNVACPRKDSYNSNSALDVTTASASGGGGDETAKVGYSGTSDRTLAGDLQVLEQKIDRLSDMFLEQCRLLTALKDDIRSSKAVVEDSEYVQNDVIYDDVIYEALKKVLKQSMVSKEGSKNSRAKSLLDAIELRQETSVDSEIREVLVDFLQSEELKESMVKATAESVKEVIDSCLSHDLTALYLPILEHSHRCMLLHVSTVVENAFKELEEYQGSLSKALFKISRSLQRAFQRHRALLTAATDPHENFVTTLKCTVEELLSKELIQWRQEVVEVFKAPVPGPEELPEPPNFDFAPNSPAEPADSQRNIIDQLIARGDVNAAFERALCAADLTLVMVACRKARGVCGKGRAGVAHCHLRPHVLLALLQQLSTDMLHDTQLKCRYLEDAILSLDPHAPSTRAHLPLVVGEVRRHLSKFLAAFPNHMAAKRVSIIIMAADNLLTCRNG